MSRSVIAGVALAATLATLPVRSSHAATATVEDRAPNAAVSAPTRAGWFGLQIYLAGSEHTLGAGPNFGMNLRFHAWRHIYVDAGASAGFIFAAGPENYLGDALYLKLSAGVTGSTGARLDGWEGLAFFRATHVHLANLESWASTPAENVLGDSTGSIIHRTGFEAGLGIIGPQIVRLGRHFDLIWEADGVFELLPTSEVMYWSAGVRFNLGLRMIRP